MLEYDDSAFYYFSFTFLTLAIIPAAYYTVKDVLAWLKPSNKLEDSARTTLEKEKAKKLAKQSIEENKWGRYFFIGRLVFLAFALLAAGYLMHSISSNDQIAQFNPYGILGLEIGADDRAIKKAYRALSLEYHPDKNPGNQTSLDIFLRVAKAYEALTDPVAKKNWEEFGNPDGKQAMEVSIGLPTFLLEKQNQNYILIIYLLFLVVIIPSAVGLWYANSKQYGEKNILYKTYGHFYQMLTEGTRLKQMPEVLAVAQEYFELNAPRLSEKEDLLRLYQRLRARHMAKPKNENHAVILKGNCLLHAHLLRMHDELPAKFNNDLNKMLLKSPQLTDAIIEMSYQRQWLQTALAAIRFRQHLVQALWPTEPASPALSLKQIPHFTDNEVKHITSGRGKSSCKTLGQYLKVEPDQRKGLADLSPDQRADVEAVLKLMPQVEVSLKLFVEEDDDSDNIYRGDIIVEKDIMTLRVNLTRNNVAEGETAPPVHAPFFPVPLTETWWVIVTFKGENILAADKITSQEREATAELKFMAPPQAGNYSLTIHVLPDCYVGLDEEKVLNFTVEPISVLPEYQVHEEDKELDNEPSLFDQMLQPPNVDESDSDDEDEQQETGGDQDAQGASEEKEGSPQGDASDAK